MGVPVDTLPCPTCGSFDVAEVWRDPSLTTTPVIFECPDCGEFRVFEWRGTRTYCGRPAPLPASCPAKGCGRPLHRHFAPGYGDIWSHHVHANRDSAMADLPRRIEYIIWNVGA